MNTLMKQISALAALALLASGCAKESKNNNVNNGNIIAPGGAGVVPAPIGAGTSTSSTGITFVPVSLAEMNTYVATRPLNYPTDFRIALNLQDNGQGRYSGDVRISYTDVGRRYEGVFTAENSLNVNLSGLRDSGVNDSTYNYWFMMGSNKVFSGFFEDDIGSIVLIIDNVVDQGDGQGGSSVSGQVWYRNFAQSLAPKSPYRSCWFITSGPYNCRSNHVIQKSALYPTDSYRKLGSFSGYVKANAFQ